MPHIKGLTEDRTRSHIQKVRNFLHNGRQPQKNHAAIDRRHGFIRGWNVTSASAYDGAQLRNVLNRANTGSTVWADTAYRSKKNEEWLDRNGYVSEIHHKKPKGRPMSEATSRANGRRSKTRAFVEHVFARQKAQMKLFIRTIGIARARTKIGMTNLAYNLMRYVWHQGRTAPAGRQKRRKTTPRRQTRHPASTSTTKTEATSRHQPGPNRFAAPQVSEMP